jgi:transcriptional regulator with XRE-family HTH domain
MTFNLQIPKIVIANYQQKFAEFGEKLGLTYSAISAIEIGKNPPTDANIKLICLTYGVNEDWIRSGNGEMFTHVNNDSLTKEVIEFMQKMDEPERQVVLNYVRCYVSQQQSLRGEPPDAAKEPDFPLEPRLPARTAAIANYEEDRTAG